MVIDMDTKVGKILKCLGGLISYVSAFSSGHDPRVLGLSDTLGSLLSGEPASPSPSPSAAPPAVLSLPLSQINKVFKKDLCMYLHLSKRFV